MHAGPQKPAGAQCIEVVGDGCFSGLSDFTNARRRRSLICAQTSSVSFPLSPKGVTEFGATQSVTAGNPCRKPPRAISTLPSCSRELAVQVNLAHAPAISADGNGYPKTAKKADLDPGLRNCVDPLPSAACIWTEVGLCAARGGLEISPASTALMGKRHRFVSTLAVERIRPGVDNPLFQGDRRVRRGNGLMHQVLALISHTGAAFIREPRR
jgi:hypothetical protein